MSKADELLAEIIASEDQPDRGPASGYWQRRGKAFGAARAYFNEKPQPIKDADGDEWEPRDEDKRMIEQFCKELNLAHDELLIGQGCANTDTGNFDWPEGTPQASSIRWAERLLGRKLAKTNLWTLFPPSAADK